MLRSIQMRAQPSHSLAGAANRTSRAGRDEPWSDLGHTDLANAVRRISTLCGWTRNTVGTGQILAVSSAVEREGKSSLARALAISTSRDHAGEVLLLECDLLRPSLSGDFAIAAAPGLSELLAGEATLDEALRDTSLPNLRLLPAGEPYSNPSRLLRSPAMAATLQDIRERFAFVVVDLPAVLTSSDASVLAGQMDGVVLVVRVGSTDHRAVQEAARLLAGTTLHGVVLNRARTALPRLVRKVLAV
jgi:capsular exopolysaccharide synthesis family protein